MFPLSRADAATGWLAPGPWRQALAIALKAYASVLALSLLVLTERFGRLIGAIRSLGLPAAVGSALAVAGSFLEVLGAAAARMKRARESRTPGRLRAPKVGTIGRSAALVFLRGFDRSKRVHAAMESRGFTGSMPALNPVRVLPRDLIAADRDFLRSTGLDFWDSLEAFLSSKSRLDFVDAKKPLLGEVKVELT